MSFENFKSFIAKKSSLEFLIVFGLAFTAATSAVSWWFRWYWRTFAPYGDMVRYLEMATHLFGDVAEPFRYRILTPLITHFMPFPIEWNFFVLNLLVLWATCVLMYYFLKELGFSFQESIIGFLLFCGNFVVVSHLGGVLVDSLAYFFLLLAIFAIIKKNDAMFVFATLIGVMVKETVLLALPVYLFVRRKWIRTFLLSLPSVVLFVFIRFLFAPEESAYYAARSLPFLSILLENPLRMLGEILVSFQFLWLLALAGFRYASNPIKRISILIPLAFLQILIAKDWYRVLFFAFPAIIPLALVALQKLSLISSDLRSVKKK